jgi:hypothetical protein
LDHLKPVVKEKKTRTNKFYDTNNIRKSTRRRIKKTVFMMQNLKGLNWNLGGFGLYRGPGMILFLIKSNLFTFYRLSVWCTSGSVVGSTVTGGAAGCYGFWMHMARDGRLGYLVPGWLAAS